jgi:thiamine pyrophosphate-dependent acetolactate synthase large subunit-like protein
MGMGSLATIGVKQPKNLAIVVLDNRHYSATGMQASHTAAGVDLAATAQACRFAHVEQVSEIDSAAAMRALLHTGQGPIFIHARVEADDQPRIIPSRDGHGIKQRFLQASAKQG